MCARVKFNPTAPLLIFFERNEAKIFVFFFPETETTLLQSILDNLRKWALQLYVLSEKFIKLKQY